MSPWRSNGCGSPVDANGNGSGNLNFIQHEISRFDTLAGVAIKYGVEVADIKRLNNLATDLQMFALRSLHIPLPGRHPPSPVLPDCSTNSRGSNHAKTLPRIGNTNMLEPCQPLRSKSPQQEISSAMNTLQKYYGLKSPCPKKSAEAEEMEMAVYRNGTSDYFDDRLLPRALPTSDLFSSHRQKSRDLIGDFLLESSETVKDTHIEETGDGEGERSYEKRVRRRQKSEVDSNAGTPERLLKEDNGSGSSDFSPITGKGLALRPKSGSRTLLEADAESGRAGLGDSILTGGVFGVRKSSSMPSLPDEDNSSSSSAWPTPLWSLKADLQVLSAASITRPIFDGLPKPITGRRNKAALD